VGLLEPRLAKAKANQNQGARTDIPQKSAKGFTPADTRAEMAKRARVSHDTIAKGKVIVAEVLRSGTVARQGAHWPRRVREKVLETADSLMGWTQPVFNGFIVSQRWQSRHRKNCGRVQA